MITSCIAYVKLASDDRFKCLRVKTRKMKQFKCFCPTYTCTTPAACSYQGELLGLLAIHLILLSISKINPTLTGSVHIFPDCLGALNRVKNLPPHQIPSKSRHSRVLTMIMIHCSSMSFDCLFLHISAHQDNRKEFESLLRVAQLNCACDFGVK